MTEQEIQTLITQCRMICVASYCKPLRDLAFEINQLAELIADLDAKYSANPIPEPKNAKPCDD